MTDMSRQDDAERTVAPADQDSTATGATATDVVRRRLIQTALVAGPVIVTLRSGEAHAGISALGCYNATTGPRCY